MVRTWPAALLEHPGEFRRGGLRVAWALWQLAAYMPGGRWGLVGTWLVGLGNRAVVVYRRRGDGWARYC